MSRVFQVLPIAALAASAVIGWRRAARLRGSEPRRGASPAIAPAPSGHEPSRVRDR